jgi:GT2 family glycosyltransferase
MVILIPDSSVTVAIPTLAGGPILDSCLDALSKQVFREFEVIIINNGVSKAMNLRQPLPFRYRVISPASNVGFGAAINLAIRDTSSPFIATLNDDTEPHPEWLSSLVREMHADPKAGMCASRILMRDSGAIDSAGMLICFDGSSKQRGHSLSADSFRVPDEVLFPSACAALYRRRMLDEIGLFDEEYFLYCEDTDLGLRARWAGWKCRYIPSAVVTHRYSSTAGAFSLTKARFVERNRIWVALKNFPVVMLLIVPFVSIARFMWQLTGAGVTTGATARFFQSGNSLFAAAGIVARAHWDTLRHLQHLLRKRVQMRKTRRLGSLEFAKLMYRHRITARDIART